MRRNINDNLLEEIKKSQEFLDFLWDDQKAMQDTINTEHPDFIARTSDEYDCYKSHEESMMRIERIKRQLMRLKSYINHESLTKVQIPFG